jgi:hypothetical protein
VVATIETKLGAARKIEDQKLGKTIEKNASRFLAL